MKQVALGRNNWMLIGSVAAGYRAADLMSLVSSAHRNDLDIFVCGKDVLNRLLAGETLYDALRPDVWKQTHPEAIRIYRVDERQARADAKAVKRTRRGSPRTAVSAMRTPWRWWPLTRQSKRTTRKVLGFRTPQGIELGFFYVLGRLPDLAFSRRFRRKGLF
jgi:hypothetical protein